MNEDLDLSKGCFHSFSDLIAIAKSGYEEEYDDTEVLAYLKQFPDTTKKLEAVMTSKGFRKLAYFR